MSDQAPERIWATEDAKNHGEDRFHTRHGPMRGLTEYIRADLATTNTAAAVTAALREAAESLDARYQGALARSDADPLSEHKSYTASAFGVALADVTALVTPSGTAALDDAIARAVAEKDAEIARLRYGPTVKPLVWVDFGNYGSKADAWLDANYIIQKWSDGRWEITAGYPGYVTGIFGIDRFHPALDDAKAAAQADYTARILAALDLPTEGGAL